jgi:hypothetical protein
MNNEPRDSKPLLPVDLRLSDNGTSRADGGVAVNTPA